MWEVFLQQAVYVSLALPNVTSLLEFAFTDKGFSLVTISA